MNKAQAGRLRHRLRNVKKAGQHLPAAMKGGNSRLGKSNTGCDCEVAAVCVPHVVDLIMIYS